MSEIVDTYMLLLILGGALATYATRVGGYILMKRFANIPPRIEAGLNAVPVAVLTTLAAPAFFEGGMEVKISMILALIVGLKFRGMPMLIVGCLTVVSLRNFLFV